MNRLDNIFKGENKVLSVFITAGYPNLNSTVSTVLELESYGVDLIELGIPFSDPLADGPTIQKSSERAILNGMNISVLFDQIREIREESQIPLVLMGYLNPILQYGLEEFLFKCAENNIDGLIIPDLSPEIYSKFYSKKFENFKVPLVFLITPKTPEERIIEIDRLSGGFLYLVSSASITGAKSEFSEEQISDFEKISNMNLSNPILVGFGIHNRTTFEAVTTYFSGAIVGSAFIRAIDNKVEIPDFVGEFRNEITPLISQNNMNSLALKK